MIGQAMVGYILNQDDFREIYHWLLVTRDAHGVFQKSRISPSSPSKQLDATQVWQAVEIKSVPFYAVFCI